MAAEVPSRGARRWTLGEAVVVVAGALLVLDLVALPWHHINVDAGLEQFGISLPSFTLDRSGVQNPQAFFGIASAVIATLMVAVVVASKVSAAVPRLAQAHLIAGPVVLGLVVAKLMANDDFLAVGAWAGTALAAGLAYGGFVLSQEASDGALREVPVT